MEIIKTSDMYNPLLKRKELAFLINHLSKETPKLFEVRKALTAMYGVKEEAVFIMKLNTINGTNQTRGKAEVYDDPERAKLLVHKYIQSRNLAVRSKKGEIKEKKKVLETKKKEKVKNDKAKVKISEQENRKT